MSVNLILKDINDRLGKLVNAAPCMVFMKGTPQEPRCGQYPPGLVVGTEARCNHLRIFPSLLPFLPTQGSVGKWWPF